MLVKLYTGFGQRINGRNRLLLPGETVDLPDAEAGELISLGLAVRIETAPDWSGTETEDVPDPGDTPTLEEMTVAQLKVMALDLGLDISDCRRKQDLIDRIAGEDGMEDGVEDGEEPPELGAEAPVV